MAIQRLDDSRFLFQGGRYPATIYLAGYSVECGLKALILSTKPKRSWKAVSEEFRGSGWHEINRLYEVYLDRGGQRSPPEVNGALTYAHANWFVGLRYLPENRTYRESKTFLDSSEAILSWVEKRL